MSGYDFKNIEQHWQSYWDRHKTFRAISPREEGFDPEKPKFYVLDMFPYPSGVGLHVGHPLGYIATDIYSRYKRMRGFNVLHPMGFDAFGLPAEQFAVEHGVHPRITTEKNIQNMVRQLKRLGLSYDWDRAVATTDVEYYKWTQWIFLQLFNSWFDPAENRARPIAELVQLLEAEELYVDFNGELVNNPAEGLEGIQGDPIGVRKWYELDRTERQELLDSYRLAYIAEVPVNWCPALGTVLANEEVTNDGRSERGNHPVYQRPLKQWMLRITSYAERLGDDLELVEWPEPIKLMQRNWIGRSEGALVEFPLEGDEADSLISVFTTRPDTLFGATYMVLAPEHPLVEQITTVEQRGPVRQYQQQAAKRTDMERQAEGKTKTGVFTGAYAINPVNQERVPIWIADYVLITYGTGAIMAVPGHDHRDFEFAKQFDLPIHRVVAPSEEAADEPLDEAFAATGVSVNSAHGDLDLNGLPTDEAKRVITDWLEENGQGRAKVQYKLRDWLFSRQRYWGEPFPILHGPDGEIVPVSEDELPVELPEMEDFRPHGSDDPDAPPKPPLGRAPESWRVVERDGVRYERELNTMPQWAGSCWYYLRFCDPRNEDRFVDPKAEQHWMVSNNAKGQPHHGGVDLYVGGAEHAVLHLLYARFWHKVLHDLGHISTPEPFGRLFNQGYIQAYAYQDERGMYVDATKIEETDGQYFYEGKPVTRTLGKMGKSLKNAISPDEMCDKYGCDTLRLYEMYMGPLEASKPWETRDIVGLHRFLQKVWRNFVTEDGNIKVVETPADETLKRALHRTIKRVSDDVERLSFNTAIAGLIELNKQLTPLETVPREVAQPLVLMLSPLAPHIAAELWRRMNCETEIAHEDWPSYDPAMLVEDEIEIAVQVMGKLRARLKVPADADEETIKAMAMSEETVAQQLEGKTVRKVIFVPKKLVNIVAN
ncbi:MAG: leucine--tRNA ligase [Phycisphaeraceae bacterium]